MSLILVEGIDSNEVTKVADRISDTYTFLTEDLPVPPILTRINRRESASGLNPFQEYEFPLCRFDLRNLIRSKNNLVVMDQWHVRRGVQSGRSEDVSMFHVELVLSALGAVKVLAQPDDAELISFRTKTDLESTEVLHSRYEQHREKYGYVRWSDTAPSELIQEAQERALGSARISSFKTSLRWSPGYVGPTYPQVLLVGSHRYGTIQSRLESPWAMTPWPGNDAAICLLTALLRAGMTQSVGIVHVDESETVIWDLAQINPQSVVVALGRDVSRTLRKAGVKHKTIPSPEWIKYIGSRYMNTYTQEIKKAAQWT